MWVLPSRGRPHNLRRLQKAFAETGASTRVLVRVDEDDRSPEIWHPLWTLEIGPRKPLSAVFNDFFEGHPDLPWYGILCDDVVPETKEWDKTLIREAGVGRMAIPAGGHDPKGAPHFVLGGDLVRSVGWLALPGLDRLYIDTAWIDIARALGKEARVPHVTLAHHHFSNRKALFDATYRKPNKAQDRRLYEQWRATGLEKFTA